jgi:hypothetical protein
MNQMNRFILTTGLLSLVGIYSCSHAVIHPKEKLMTQIPSSMPSQSNLPPLKLGSDNDVDKLLDSLYQQGGIQNVIEWAEKELQPGRQIIYYNNDVPSLEIPDGAALFLKNRAVERMFSQDNTLELLPPLSNIENPHNYDIILNFDRPNLKEPLTLMVYLEMNTKKN